VQCELNHSANAAATENNAEEAVVCTLFEGDYHFGVAALLNSLVRHGFQGRFVAGYRGALPPWVDQLKRLNGDACYEASPGVRLEFLSLDVAVHFANYKPQFMLRLLYERRGCRYLFYFDPDIVVGCAWSFYEQWVRNGVALCEDVNGHLPENHPLRHRWSELVSAYGWKSPRPLSRYYNGGFVGLPVSCRGFLELWREATSIAEAGGLDLKAFGEGDRTHPYCKADQDTLNIAAMYDSSPLTTIGADGMGFIPGGGTMFHAIGALKPWRKAMVCWALRGIPPSRTDKEYLASVSSPIRPYSRIGLAARRLGCAAGASIGRFYRRR
jgi:hypothetical protein